MKKLLLLAATCIALMAACSSDGSKSAQDTTTVNSQTTNEERSLTDTLGNTPGSNTSTVAELPGGALIKKNDCIGCHKDYDKVIGPAYIDVAKKYTAADKPYLLKKVKEGGKGVWGEVAMSPHPTLSDDEIGQMLDYILALNK